MHTQLTREERERISQMLFAGRSDAAIARALGRHRSTIGRERKRNSVDGRYSALQAQELAEERRQNRPHKLDCPELNDFVRSGLAKKWSPDQIAGRVRREFLRDPSRRVSRMTIYRWIARSEDRTYWESCLRFGRRRSTPERRGKIKAAAEISGRPDIVDRRARFGDWEGDTVIGKGRRGGLVTLVDRKSGFALVKLIKQIRSRHVAGAIRRATETLPGGLKHTLTLDNGKEFAAHQAITQRTGLDVYFARPYHSWERGSNEHFNGLLRQYFPKGTDFTRISPREVRHVLNQLNDRPRKRLGYKTPREVLARYHTVAIEM